LFNTQKAAYLLRANINLDLDHFREALQDCDEAEAIDKADKGYPTATSGGGDVEFLLHSLRGQALLFDNELAAALPHLEEASRLRPDDLDGYKLLAIYYNKVNENDLAIAELDKGLAIAPNDSNLMKMRTEMETMAAKRE
jgi:tetratricopeptide (TPR) repeat protein